MIRKICEGIICGIVGFIIIATMFICIFTPEKTIKGEYTQPFKYWTDDTYFQQNFIGGNNV